MSVFFAQVEDCRSLLVSVLSHPISSSNTTSSHILGASAAMRASKLVQSSGLAPLPIRECLARLHSDTPPSVPENGSWLTDIELAILSLKTWQGLALSHPAYSEGNPAGIDNASQRERDSDDDEVGPLVNEEELKESGAQLSTSLTSWDILDGVLLGLGQAARLSFNQGTVKEAVHYAQEGLILSRTLCLPYQ